MGPKLPDFEEIFDSIEEKKQSWIPTLPEYYKVYLKPRPMVTPPPGQGAAPQGSSDNDTVSTVTRTSSSRGTTQGSQKQERITNPAPSVVFEPIKGLITSKTLRQALDKMMDEPPPKVTREGTPVQMCLLYHLKGACSSNCQRHADHGPHSEAEDTELFKWAEKAFA